jgi:hypothetical protein
MSLYISESNLYFEFKKLEGLWKRHRKMFVPEGTTLKSLLAWGDTLIKLKSG